MIPSTALVFQEHGTQVAVVTEDDRIHLQTITVSRLLDSAVEVSEGIGAGDRIVNNPSAALLEGDKVRIVTPAPGYDLDQTEPSSPVDNRSRMQDKAIGPVDVTMKGFTHMRRIVWHARCWLRCLFSA